MGAVVVIHNAPGVQDLSSRRRRAGIFLGKITQWNESGDRGANKGAKLPEMHIVVAHRSDGRAPPPSSRLLAKVSPEWKSGPGAGKSVNGPPGWAARNEGSPASSSRRKAHRLRRAGKREPEQPPVAELKTGRASS